MKNYPERLNRDYQSSDSNRRIQEAYEKMLVEGYGTDKTKEIRDVLKKELGLTNRDVSVKYSGSINVKLKTVKSLPFKNKIKKVAEKHESYQRDERTGDILRGGNTFVFVELDWKFRDQLVKKIEAEISKKITDEFMNGTGGGNTITVYGNYNISKNRQSKRDEFHVFNKKSTGSAGPTYFSIIEAAGGVLSLMLELEDEKNLKKLG